MGLLAWLRSEKPIIEKSPPRFSTSYHIEGVPGKPTVLKLGLG